MTGEQRPESDMLSIENLKNEIRNSRRDLDHFSYTVSHDLRAPLRAIDGFGKVLYQKLEGKLDEEEQRYLDIVLENSKKLGRLIEDLLAFYRIGKNGIKPSEFSLNEVFQYAFNEEMKKGRLSEKTVVVAGEMPDIVADRELIKTAICQLVSNAVKFSRQEEIPKIEAGCRNSNSDRDIEFYIRDNGIGFEMEYLNKLFGIFQRLHSDEEFGGTGIGLAIVQKVIRLHGGSVSAESSPGKGAVFYFSIPALPPQES